jgi:hypothetical protein
MRYLPLVLAIGCTASDPDVTESREPTESMAVAAVTVCATGQWCAEPSPVTSLLHAAWAVSADDVFAVGDGGTILRRNSDGWTAMSSGTSCKLRGVWGASSSDVWATGLGGTILHFDGTAWSPVTVTSSEIDAVWGSSSSDVWFVGQGTVLHWDGASFTSSSFTGSLLSVSGTGPSDVWIDGENASVRHFSGSGWSLVSTGSGTNTYFAVLAIASNDVWVADVASTKETMHWNGSRWTPVRTGSGIIFESLSALASNDVWGAGGRSIGHWTGTGWIFDTQFPTGTSLWSITTTPGHAWAVGDGGLILHRSL